MLKGTFKASGAVRTSPPTAPGRLVSALLGCSCLLLASDALASAPLLWYAARSPEAEANWLLADDSCPYGSEDCNRCSSGVPFGFMGVGVLPSNANNWKFDWIDFADPSLVVPFTVWPSLGASSDIAYHAQGFVRTNGTTVKYAMSHSNDSIGTLALVGHNNRLLGLHMTSEAHPSGIFTLGQYVGMVDLTHQLRFFDTNRALESHEISYYIDPSLGGPGLREGNGGIAMAKLAGGGYLVAVGQGGENNFHQNLDLFFVDGPLTAPHRKQHLGTIPTDLQSENLSIITECGSRKIYVVHIIGDALGDQGYYNLSEVAWDAEGPYLQDTGRILIDNDIVDCHMRSAGSVGVLENGLLTRLCIGRNATDPPIIAPWPFPSSTEGKWNFRSVR